jgi:hypothetical protein
MSVSYGGDKITFDDGSTVSSGWAGFKNRIINGAMVVDQRNAGASINSTSGGGLYPVDRFEQESAVGGGVIAMQQSTTAPAGFPYSLKLTVGTADTSLAAGDRYNMRQIIEGYNVADLGFGTANAKEVTISFWVQSSLTGTYCVGLRNGTNARSYIANYTINAANTWEYKTITIPGDTTGTWGTTNGRGITLSFALASGSTPQTTVNTWSSGEYIATSSQVNWMNTVGNTFYITGVQLERGSSASSFEYRPYGTELQLCQRYYQQIGKSNNTAYLPYAIGNGVSGTLCSIILNYPVMMRTNPSFTFTGATNTFLLSGIPVTAVSGDIMGVSNCMYTASVSSGMSSGAGARHYQNNQAASSLELSAEL